MQIFKFFMLLCVVSALSGCTFWLASKKGRLLITTERIENEKTLPQDPSATN